MDAFRGHISKFRHQFKGILDDRDDIWIIDSELQSQAALAYSTRGKQGQFYLPIYHAWNVIAYDYHEPTNMHRAAHNLSRRYKQGIGKDLHPEIIELNPLQVQILDAITDVVGIPHAKGQRKIEIPEKLRSFDKWQQSGEYEAALARYTKKQRF